MELRFKTNAELNEWEWAMEKVYYAWRKDNPMGDLDDTVKHSLLDKIDDLIMECRNAMEV